MHKALIFILALIVILLIAYTKPTEGFTNLMGVNWTEMNEGTPKALYTDLPIKQPKVVDLAEAGVGNIQASPPAPGTLPSAPAPQRSVESPNPYIDPVNEPAKYIRILSVKEDLQAFFGFQAFMLEERNDPAIQIPLCRARADMAELINVASVMERNPGLPSRINNKQINDIQANLNYLRDVLHELESSGAIQPEAIVEGFSNNSSRWEPAILYFTDYYLPILEKYGSILREFKAPNELITDSESLLKTLKEEANPKNLDELTKKPFDPMEMRGLQEMGKGINTILDNLKVPKSKFPPLVIYQDSYTVQDVVNLIKSDSRTRNRKITTSGQITQQTTQQPTIQTISPPAPAVSDTRRATLKELQDFQIKVVVEINRLSASGTSDPVINGRLNTLQRIKDDVDQVITQLQNGSITPETVPIFSKDIERALPILGRPSDPLPTVLRKADLPPAVASLFPGGMSPRDTEQAQQINNITKGYMKNLFEGASWGIKLNFKYDNPNIAKLEAKKAEAEAKVAKALKEKKSDGYNFNTGLPGVMGSARLMGADTMKSMEGPAVPNFEFTDSNYDSGLPGTSVSRTLPEPRAGRLDWRQRSQQIKEQIRRRGLNPHDFGALPDDAIVGNDFSWRGYTQMMCMRLNTTTDPGLAETCGCPPKGWEGWRD